MNKYLKLFICIVIDAIGYFSFAIPFIGEMSDAVWAPISAVLLFLLFGKQGAGAALINFTEEIIPGLDFIPTLTLTWIYIHVIGEKKEQNDLKNK